MSNGGQSLQRADILKRKSENQWQQYLANRSASGYSQREMLPVLTRKYTETYEMDKQCNVDWCPLGALSDLVRKQP